MSDDHPVDQPVEETAQPGWRRVTSSRWAFAVGVSAMVIGVGVLFIVSSSGNPSGGTADSHTESSTPLDPVEQCVVNVMGLMNQSLQAVQNGYQNGIDPNDVAVQYGTESPTFRAFSQAQPTLIDDVYTHGASGELTRIQLTVRMQCGQWQPRPLVTVGPPSPGS